MSVVFGQTAGGLGQRMQSYFRSSLAEFPGTLQRIKAKDNTTWEVTPLPDGWSFQYDRPHLQIAIRRADFPQRPLLFRFLRTRLLVAHLLCVSLP